MYARIAMFEMPADGEPAVGDRILAEVRRRMTDGGGPTGSRRVMILMEPDRRRAMNITLFDSEADMEAAESFFEAMQPPDAQARGRRTDVGHYRVMLDEPVSGEGASH